MDWLTNNLPYIIIAICAIVLLVYGIMTGKVKEWLKYAVAYAEAELGSGTGQLKLRTVYDMFLSQFPMFSKIVTFNTFSNWVDLALKWLNEQIEKNINIEQAVNGLN